MDWAVVLILVFSGFLVLLAAGMPVAFGFLLVNIIGMALIVGPEATLMQITHNIFDILTSFTLLPMVLFILMGEITFTTGTAERMIDTVDQWLGHLPGRLGLLAVAAGTVLSTLTGVPMASVAILGQTLVPEMEKRGYKKSMSLGPVLGSGGLAMMIPPSSMAILIGVLGDISIGKLLIAIIVPGLLMAVTYFLYIVIRCSLQPHLAPPYDPPTRPLSQKLKITARNVLPLIFIIFSVMGLILVGVATPSEAAATGAFACLLVGFYYRGVTWKASKKIVMATASVSVMVMMIVMTSSVYSQLLAYTGATAGLATFIDNMDTSTVVIFLAVQIIPLVLGMFMGATAVIMLSIPVVMPIILVAGIDPVVYGVTLLICAEIGTISPPYGLSLFIMKAIAPPGTTMKDVYMSALPYCYMNVVIVALIILVPQIALWLPNMFK
ncbi:MAG: TRAP transporter large permease [Chloroflexota bacterium]|nr:TRAP transporter large permease [Chloroflexota bacterium]